MVTEKKTYMSEDVNICILSELKIYKRIANNNLDGFKSYWLHKKSLSIYVRWEINHDDKFVTK
jgi:hypothetical protein